MRGGRRIASQLLGPGSRDMRPTISHGILPGILGIVLFASALVSTAAQGQEIKVTLLGTGCPPAVMNRFGPSLLVDAGGQTFLFDAGRGALQRLNQVKVRWQDVHGVFLTHLHSDHVVGFPHLWLIGWLTPGRDVPLHLPAGGFAPERAKSVIAHHVTPEQAGEVFSRAKPKQAVYSHIVLPTATEHDLIPPTRKTYSRPLELGEDLMVIEVGERIEVRRPTRSSP
jgi:ribonuclease BN (tRNA processing enzyme)